MSKTRPALPFNHNALTGMMLAAAAFALLTAMDVIFKLLATGGHPTYQILLLNGCFALIPIFIWTMSTGGFTRFATRRLSYHLMRGATSVLSTFAAVYAYSRLPLTDFYAIMFAGPLIVTGMAALWLGEKLEPMRWFAILVGFIGILVVTDPLSSPLLQAHSEALDARQTAHMLGRIAAFASVFCYALSVIMIRHMRAVETNMSFSFYGYVASLSICGVLCLLCGVPQMTWHEVGLLAMSGTMAGISSICMMTAYHRAPIGLIAPFQYTQIIWGAIAGYVLWQHLPSHHLMAGATIVAVSGFYVIHREMKAPVARKPALKARKLKLSVRPQQRSIRQKRMSY